jgi:hypothetical protein
MQAITVFIRIFKYVYDIFPYYYMSTLNCTSVIKQGAKYRFLAVFVTFLEDSLILALKASDTYFPVLHEPHSIADGRN